MKKVLALVVFMIACFGLVACGNNSGTAGFAEYNVLTVEELKAADSVEVSMRVPFGDNIQAEINRMIEEFTVEYPNVTITLDYVGGYTELKKSIIEDINGGDAPTMSVGYPDHFAEYLISNAIIPLDAFINDPNVGYTSDEMSDFIGDYVSENRQFDKAGTYFGLPFNKSTEVLYYNKDFFNEFALDVPATWDELETTTTEIMNIVKGLDDNEYSWLPTIKTDLSKDEFIPMLYDSNGNLFTTSIHQWGGEYTESIYKSNGAVDVQKGTMKFGTNANAKKALEDLQALAQKNCFNLPELWDISYGSNAFNPGKSVMNIGSSGGSSHYSDCVGEVGVAPILYKDADKKYVIQQGTNLCIFSQASDLEKLAAWLFIKYMLTPENTAKFSMATGYSPIRQSAYSLPEYTEFLEGDTTAAKVLQVVSQYTANGWHYFVDAAWAGSSTVRDECGVALSNILVDGAKVQEAIDAAIDRI